MRRWIISDTHWGHSEILRHCRRPENQDHLIMENWSRLVAKNDVVYHLGDVAWSFYLTRLKLWLDELPGRKILIMGNHDTKSQTFYMENGFDFACDGAMVNGCWLTHQESPNLPDGCYCNIHGHHHNRIPVGTRIYPRSRFFSLEYMDYKPVALEKFLRLEAKAHKNLKGLSCVS